METSIVVFEQPELQDHLKILSIDGKPRNSNTVVDYQKFTLIVESYFCGVSFNFTMDFLTDEEVQNRSRAIGYPILLSVDNGEASLKNNNLYYKSDEFLAEYNWYKLNEIIFDVFFSYFKESNKFKLLNTFY